MNTRMHLVVLLRITENMHPSIGEANSRKIVGSYLQSGKPSKKPQSFEDDIALKWENLLWFISECTTDRDTF